MANRLWVLGLVGSVALGTVYAGSASASTVTITLEESGFTSQSVSGNGTASFNGQFGTFIVNNISGTASPLVGDALDSNSFNVSTSGSSSATLTVLVTASGLTQPTGAFFSALTQNSVTAGATVVSVKAGSFLSCTPGCGWRPYSRV